MDIFVSSYSIDFSQERAISLLNSELHDYSVRQSFGSGRFSRFSCFGTSSVVVVAR